MSASTQRPETTVSASSTGRMALIALPWSEKARPSAAVAALAAYIRRERPGWEVECRQVFVPFAARIGFELYDAIADKAYSVGELLNSSLLYPEKTADVRRYFERWAKRNLGPEVLRALRPEARTWGAAFDRVAAALRAQIDELVEEVGAGFDAVGLTTSFGQLFVNLAFARRLKERAPATAVILGGSTVSARVGPSLLGEYAFVDYVVQGEGERPLVALLDALAGREGAEGVIDGVVSRRPAGAAPAAAALSEIRSLDDLPIPDYDDYASMAEEHGIGWAMPVEASRGCWWDRTKRTANPAATCYFCNLNVQWGGYREKSVQRVAREMDELSSRYRNLRLFFVDNIVRSKGVPELAEAIAEQQKDYYMFLEMRASTRPYEILRMWEAGLRETQFGIEGLSTSFLRRIGKGTTVIQNLQAMRICRELGIDNKANLIVSFPGSTREEVEETRRNLLDYAVSLQPLNIATFQLGVGSTVDSLREKFGVVGVRNKELYKTGLPEAVWRRLQLFDLDFDLEQPGVDWGPVLDACEAWRKLHHRGKLPLLFYQDGGSFLNIVDNRGDAVLEGTYEGLARDIYLYCTEIRTVAEVSRKFGTPDAAVLELLEEFVADRLMFSEQGRYLSLAVASTPHAAARRIRALHGEECDARAAQKELAGAAA